MSDELFQPPTSKKGESQTSGDDSKYINSFFPVLTEMASSTYSFQNDELHRKPYRRLSDEEVCAILERKKDGVSLSDIAAEFNVTARQIHRVVSQNAGDGEISHKKKKEGSLKEYHSAWIYEEMLENPQASLSAISVGLEQYFGLKVSVATLWRHMRTGTMEQHGYPGYTKPDGGSINVC